MGNFSAGSKLPALLHQSPLSIKKPGTTVTKGDNQQAIADYTKAIQLNDKEGWAYFNRSKVYERLRDNEKAKADCIKARQLGIKIGQCIGD